MFSMFQNTLIAPVHNNINQALLYHEMLISSIIHCHGIPLDLCDERISIIVMYILFVFNMTLYANYCIIAIAYLHPKMSDSGNDMNALQSSNHAHYYHHEFMVNHRGNLFIIFENL